MKQKEKERNHVIFLHEEERNKRKGVMSSEKESWIRKEIKAGIMQRLCSPPWC